LRPRGSLRRLFGSRIFRRQLVAFFALIVCGTALLTFAIGFRTTSELLERQEIVGERYRDQIEAALHEWYDSRLTAVRAFSIVLGEMDAAGLSSPALSGRIDRIVEAYPDFVDIVVVDSRGVMVNSRRPTRPGQTISVADREYFVEAMVDGVGITGFFAGRNTGRRVMTIATRFGSKDGKTYVAAAFITLDRFSIVLDALNAGGLGAAYLVDGQANLMLGGDLEDSTAPVANPAALAAARGEKGSASYTTRSGESILGAYSWMREINAGLVVELDRKLFLEPIERLRSFAWLTAAAMIVLAAAIAFALSAQLYGPIEDLRRAVDGIAASDYSRTVGTAKTDELGVLIERFARMQGLVAERETALKDGANRDSLTGLYNHRAVMEYLNRTLAEGISGGVFFAMLDIDRFKSVNDTYGHQGGDEVLRAVAALLHSAVRSDDVVGRYGGEEFAIVVRNAATFDNALFCERIRQKIEESAIVHNGAAIRITASIGWATCGEPGAMDAGSLVSAADTALYRAKAGGRNRVERG
jgi:diguanylate cyclase (GGDEF)-like protein